MTSAATTAAGKAAPKAGKANKSSATGAKVPADRTHRRIVRPAGPAPRSPRRVSGPARPAPSGAETAAPRIASPGLGRRSVPAARIATPRRLSLPRRAAGSVLALPDHRWLDRIVRGRAWIPVLGVMLVAIVGMQVEVLKLGANVGRSINLATELQSRNQLLKASVAQLSDDSRIERLAASMGMVMPGPTDYRFVRAGGPGAVGKAISGIAAPDPSTFLATLAAERTTELASDPTTSASVSTGAASTVTPATTPASDSPVSTVPSTGIAATTGTIVPATTGATVPATTGATVPATQPTQSPVTTGAPTAGTASTGGAAG